MKNRPGIAPAPVLRCVADSLLGRAAVHLVGGVFLRVGRVVGSVARGVRLILDGLFGRGALGSAFHGIRLLIDGGLRRLGLILGGVLSRAVASRETEAEGRGRSDR